jgi:hypothetical protein
VAVEVLTDFADLAVLLPLATVVAATIAAMCWLRGALAWTVAVVGVLGTILVVKVLLFASKANELAWIMHESWRAWCKPLKGNRIRLRHPHPAVSGAHARQS